MTHRECGNLFPKDKPAGTMLPYPQDHVYLYGFISQMRIKQLRIQGILTWAGC